MLAFGDANGNGDGSRHCVRLHRRRNRRRLAVKRRRHDVEGKTRSIVGRLQNDGTLQRHAQAFLVGILPHKRDERIERPLQRVGIRVEGAVERNHQDAVVQDSLGLGLLAPLELNAAVAAGRRRLDLSGHASVRSGCLEQAERQNECCEVCANERGHRCLPLGPGR